jgi:hypothetical protein
MAFWHTGITLEPRLSGRMIMTVGRSEDTSHQRDYTLLSRIFICAGITLATLWLAIGLINFVLAGLGADRAVADWKLDSNKTWTLRLEFWLRDMVPVGMQPACFATDKQVCQVTDIYSRHVDFYGHPSEGVDLSFYVTFCVCAIALLPALIVLGLTIWLTGGRSWRKSTSMSRAPSE